jgi:hyaluronoglucosaminidase
VTATASHFQIRGVVEGFYGVYYTLPQRLDLLCFLGQQGFNLYVYGPKNDRQHRNRWRDAYPDDILDDFAQTTAAARAAGVSFCYALSPGVSIRFSEPAEFTRMTAKLESLYACGVRAFSLLLDDIASRFQHAEDEAYHRGNYAAGQADLCNRTLEWLRLKDSACSLSMCPTEYHGNPPFSPYLLGLGRELHPDIDVFYTGPEVCSPSLPTSAVRWFGEAVGRPPLLWDNYPVNDLDMQPELHVGAIRGRPADLAAAVHGVVVNPMIQPEASKIPLRTWAEYLADPAGYEPEGAWNRALAAVAGAAGANALRRVAENSLRSCLGTPEAPVLARLVDAVLLALQAGEPASSPAVAALGAYLASLDESIYHLRNRLRNLALRADLLPWLEQLENWYHVGRLALALLAAREAGQPLEPGVEQLGSALSAARRHPKRIAGEVLVPLAQHALAAAGAGAVP